MVNTDDARAKRARGRTSRGHREGTRNESRVSLQSIGVPRRGTKRQQIRLDCGNANGETCDTQRKVFTTPT